VARRRVAAVVLAEAGDPAAFAPLADRALDADPRVAAAAAAALARNRRHPGMRSVPERLRRALLSGVASRAAGAARALGALRDVEAVPLLVQALETGGPAAEAAADALTRITLQRLGVDARRWLTWWKENRGHGRAEWLLSGLTSPDRDVRLAAAAELAAAAPPPVDYSADAPPEDRESAARAWAGWWARSGQVL
jgi:HEAT repeat protein